MRVGVTFPTVELGVDLGAVRDFVQAAEDLGYDYIRILDHVLGANPEFHPKVDYFAYTHESVTHEPFTLMAYIAGFTSKLNLVTGVLILPQRQTALVAKQAAEIDFLSGGRLRLGIGVGWNPVEYEALGEDFHNRGSRCDEQIEVLRALWTQEVVDYEGRWHKISHAGLNPMPVQRPIPIWLGVGRSIKPIPPNVALRRVGRLADGWMPQLQPGEETAHQTIAKVHQYARDAGRDPSNIALEGRVNLSGTNPEDWLAQAKAWDDMGASHLAAGRGGPGGPKEYIESIRLFKEAMG